MAEGYNARRPDTPAPEEQNQEDAAALNDEATSPAENDAETADNQFITPEQAAMAAATAGAAGTILNAGDPDNVMSFEAAETQVLGAISAAFDEEGEFSLFEHHDAEAFDALATSEAGKRYKLYLDNQDSNSVLTRADTENNEDASRQMSRQIYANALAENLERLEQLDAQISALDVEIADIEGEIARIEALLERNRIATEEARNRLETARAEGEQNQVEVADQQDTVAEDRERLTDLGNRLESARIAHEAALDSGSVNEIERTRLEMERVQRLWDDASERYSASRERLNELRQDGDEIRTEIERLEGEINALDKEAANYEEELRRLNTELLAKEQERASLIEQRGQIYQDQLAMAQADPETYEDLNQGWISQQVEWLMEKVSQGSERAANALSFITGGEDGETPASSLSLIERDIERNQKRLERSNSRIEELKQELKEAQEAHEDLQTDIVEQTDAVEDAEADLEEDRAAEERALKEVINNASEENIEALETARAATEESLSVLEAANQRLDELNTQEADILTQIETLQAQLGEAEANGGDLDAVNASLLEAQRSREQLLTQKEELLDKNIAAMEENPDAYSDLVIQGRYQLRSDIIDERTQVTNEIARLEEELKAAQEEYDQALSDSVYTHEGAADLADMGFSELYADALTISNENGTPEFKIMASYDEDGNRTGILVSDGRLAMEERATQPAIPLDQYSAEDQATIMAALAEAEANGDVTLIDGNEFNAGLERSREASAAIARNEQFEAATPGMQIDRLQAASTHLESVEQELATATGNTITSASAIDGEGIKAKISLSETYAHAGEARDEPLDNPDTAPTQTGTEYVSNGTISPVAGGAAMVGTDPFLS